MPSEDKYQQQYNMGLGIVGALYLIGGIGIAPFAFENGVARYRFLLGYCIACTIFAIDMFVLLAIRNNRPESMKGLQTVLNILLLFGFPYGTVVGGYYFYRIHSQ